MYKNRINTCGVDKTGIAGMSNVVGLRRTLNQRDFETGNGEYYPQRNQGREGVSGG